MMKITKEDKEFAQKVISDLEQSDGLFSVAFLQCRYRIGYARAVRVLKAVLKMCKVEKGKFGTVKMPTPSGEMYDCPLLYRFIGKKFFTERSDS